jgi:hypothetical protein
VGGDRLDYSGDVVTSTADITTFKILINSTLSTEDAAMMMMDIKNYYLGTPFPRFEYMKMLLSRFPEEIVQKYNLNALAVDGWVYIEIRKGMYGLKQAGLIANQLLQTRLAPFGFYPACHTPGLWLHITRSISFTLVVDDFTVKYVDKQHAEHLRGKYCYTTQRCDEKYVAKIERGLIEQRDNSHEMKFKGNLENGSAKELDKDQFIRALTQKVREHGHDSFFAIEKTSGKVHDLLKDEHLFKVAEAIE